MEIAGMTPELVKNLVLSIARGFGMDKAKVTIQSVTRLDANTWLAVYIHTWKDNAGVERNERRVKLWDSTTDHSKWDMIA